MKKELTSQKYKGSLVIVMERCILSYWKIEKKWTSSWAFMTYYLNRQVTRNEIESIIKSHPAKKSLGLMASLLNFTKL